MLGAIAGDICGVPWEGGQCAAGDFQLFAEGASITDDSVCTVAIAQALLQRGDAVCVAQYLRAWCKRYPGLGYGTAFNHWVYSGTGPYNSYGNGGAMRVSPCGWLARSLDEAESLAEMTAGITHNHPEGIRGAKAISGAVWLARQGLTGEELHDRLVAQYGYDLSDSTNQLIDGSKYTTEARLTVPIALMCATRATNWAHAIELSARVGGDTDTIAAMAGAIAEARFGLPEDVLVAYGRYVTPDMQDTIQAFYAQVGGIRVEGRTVPTPSQPTGILQKLRQWLFR